MTATYTINSVAMTRVLTDVDLVEAAEHGNVGEGKITVDNTDDGALAVVGHKNVTVNESDCSDALISKGFVGQRRYYRGNPKTGANRLIDVSILDLNALLSFKVVRSNGAGHVKTRPRESVGARLTWLLASELTGLVADNGFVTYPSRMMDANDYRTQKAGDVLSDLALSAGAGFDWFVYPDPTTGDPSLFFENPNTSTDYSSTLRISNVRSDIDSSTTFAADEPISLTRDPSEVYSSTLLVYRNGRVYRTRAATATAFAARDGVAPSSTVKRRATAIARAVDFNVQHSSEQDVIECSVRLPSSKVNLIRAGMRVEAKFSDFTPEGYGSFRWFRVLSRTVKLIVSPQVQYELVLRLSPQEANFGASSIVQYKSVPQMVDVTLTFDTTVTTGNLIVAILNVGNGTTETPHMDALAGWTQLGSTVLVHAAYNPSTHIGALSAWYKIATGPSDTTVAREGTSAGMWMVAWELAHADVGSVDIVSKTQQSGASTQSLGTLTGYGAALMAMANSRGTDQANNGFAYTGGTDWVDLIDQSVNPGPFGGYEPWVYYAHSLAVAGSIAAQAGVVPTASGQTLGQWAGIGLLFD